MEEAENPNKSKQNKIIFHDMKTITSILVACLLMALPMKAQWTKTLTGQSALIDQVSVVSDSVIWIKDVNGDKFSITLNGGRTWTTKNFPVGISTPGTTSSLSAVSDQVAFVILSIDTPTNTRGVYKTTDGGVTWVRQTTAFNSPLSFPDQVYFWNVNQGLCIGDGISTANGILEMYTTTNGGTQWTPVTAANMPVTGSTDAIVNTQGYMQVTGNTVYVLSDTSGNIYKSINNGVNWSVIHSPSNGYFASLNFKDVNHGLVTSSVKSTNLSSVYNTSDGGVTWTMTYSSPTIAEIKYIPCAANYLISKTPGLSYSADGVSFLNHPSFTNIFLNAIGYTPSGKIFIGGVGYIYSATNITGSISTAVPSVLMNDAIIVGYKIYSLSGQLLITANSPGGVKLQNIMQTMNKGLYLMNAKLSDGQYQHFKFMVQ